MVKAVYYLYISELELSPILNSLSYVVNNDTKLRNWFIPNHSTEKCSTCCLHTGRSTFKPQIKVGLVDDPSLLWGITSKNVSFNTMAIFFRAPYIFYDGTPFTRKLVNSLLFTITKTLDFSRSGTHKILVVPQTPLFTHYSTFLLIHPKLALYVLAQPILLSIFDIGLLHHSIIRRPLPWLVKDSHHCLLPPILLR